MTKALFLTHKKLLGYNLTITGGVQLCSKEFYQLLKSCDFEIEPYYVNYTKNIIKRLALKFRLDCYYYYDVKSDQKKLVDYINENHIKYVFINHATAVRYAKPIRDHFGFDVKVYMLSHGNDSGDFLHSITKPIKKYNLLTKYRDIFRLGRLLYTESLHRKKYLDGVLTVSEIEENLEKWLGASKVIYTPRVINKETNFKLNTDYSKIGFIGRLDHPPNYHGINMICQEIAKTKIDFEFALIGGPKELGKEFEKKYPFISFKGELDDNQLEDEICTWSLFLNLVFWFPMGVSTKVAKAIEWGIPILTTTAGIRGYKWKDGSMLMAESPEEMAQQIKTFIADKNKIDNAINEMKKIKHSSYSTLDLAKQIKPHFNI